MMAIIDCLLPLGDSDPNDSGLEFEPDRNVTLGNDLEISVPVEPVLGFCNDDALFANSRGNGDSLFGPEHPYDQLFDETDDRGCNISFGQHVEDKDWNLNKAKWYEDIEKRERHEADLDLQKDDVKAAREHIHSAELAHKKKNEYIQAAKNCKK